MIKDLIKEKKRGRPKKRWIYLIKEDTGISVASVEKYAKDRKKWRNNIKTKWAKALSKVCN